jgi:hypothetical protein
MIERNRSGNLFSEWNEVQRLGAWENNTNSNNNNKRREITPLRFHLPSEVLMAAAAPRNSKREGAAAGAGAAKFIGDSGNKRTPRVEAYK